MADDLDAAAQRFAKGFVGAAPPETIAAAFVAFAGEARMAWPGVRVAMERFSTFVAERVDRDADPVSALGALSAADLYLVAGCLAGDERAATRFRDHVFRDVEAAARRIDPSAGDDTFQIIYDRLFVADGDRPAKIEHYAGTGDVRRWVRVVATRLAIDQRRRSSRKREDPLGEDLMHRLSDGVDDHELRYLRDEYRKEFKEAFAAAVAALTERDRNVLRYHLEGLTAQQIGRMYRTHRVTVARWLSAIRHALLEGSRTAMRDKLGVGRRDLDSIMRLIDGEVTVSIDRLLGP